MFFNPALGGYIQKNYTLGENVIEIFTLLGGMFLKINFPVLGVKFKKNHPSGKKNPPLEENVLKLIPALGGMFLK